MCVCDQLSACTCLLYRSRKSVGGNSEEATRLRWARRPLSVSSSSSVSDDNFVDLTNEGRSSHAVSTSTKVLIIDSDSDDDIIEMELPAHPYKEPKTYKRGGQSKYGSSRRTSDGTEGACSLKIGHVTPTKQVGAIFVTEKTSPASKHIINCPVCMETVQQFEKDGRHVMVTHCGHIFCNECIKKAVKAQQKCPNCRKPVKWNNCHPLFLS